MEGFLSFHRHRSSLHETRVKSIEEGHTLLAVLLVLTLDQAQFALQSLELGQQVAVVLQQLAVLLDESG